jgi:hypothetical protein
VAGWRDCSPLRNWTPPNAPACWPGGQGGDSATAVGSFAPVSGWVEHLTAAIREQGLTTPEAIGAALKAGTNCGSCVPELRQLIAQG